MEEEGREDDGGREWQGGQDMCSPRDDNTPLLFTCRCKMDGREGRPRQGITGSGRLDRIAYNGRSEARQNSLLHKGVRARL